MHRFACFNIVLIHTYYFVSYFPGDCKTNAFEAQKRTLRKDVLQVYPESGEVQHRPYL